MIKAYLRILISIFALVPFGLSANCNVHQLDGGDGFKACNPAAPCMTSFGQTFEACQTGFVHTISVTFRGDASQTFGLGGYTMTMGQPTGGIISTNSQAFQLNAVGPTTVTFANPVPVNAGTTYEFQIKPDQMVHYGVAVDGLADYPDGNFTINGVLASQIDMDFTVDIRDEPDSVGDPGVNPPTTGPGPGSGPAPVPTLGEWGLIILGQLFLIIGIVTMRQTKLQVQA